MGTRNCRSLRGKKTGEKEKDPVNSLGICWRQDERTDSEAELRRKLHERA
jgi:hypothetical protein